METYSCPECDAEIIRLFPMCTEVHCSPFTDKDGVEHCHDTNSHSAEIKCDNGHYSYMPIDAPQCPAKCGFGTELGSRLHGYTGGTV